ncbi:MAG: transcriptional regulator [Rhodospirillales bacterium]|nr:transcriptional regulator [Rhodospirillales bacterium]
MPSGQDSAKNALRGSDTSHARRIGRVCELPEGFKADFSTDGSGCSGISAQVHRVRADRDVATFTFEDISIAFLHKGTITASFELASVVHTFNCGGMAILPPGSRATLTLSDADCTVIYLKPDLIPDVKPERFAGLEIVPQIDPVDLQMTFLIACIREELQSGQRGGPRFMESLGLAMANHIFARYSTSVSSKTTFRGGLKPRQTRRAQQTMMATLDESVPLAKLAKDAGLSPWYFCRAFKQSTGVSPHQWMLERRFEQARQLMADDRRTLTSIAIDLGFASLSHFSAAFKQATGISPTHYRRNVVG